MMSLKDISDYFISVGLATGFGTDIYIGKIDSQIEEVLGLYTRTTSVNELMIGGLDNTTAEQKNFTVLVHWNTNMIESEDKAIDIYEHFRANQTPVIGGFKVFDIVCTSGQPIDVTQAEKNNIHELVLDYQINYNRI